ncbi:hypothetical protein G6F57_021412 [Rhizopus arrhizus]|nr:hypothetical protein G6F57_021412 [Rhizopus arrhizus]
MATTMPTTSAPPRASNVSADTIVCPVLPASSTTSTRRPRRLPARFGSTYNNFPASGVRVKPSPRATSGANARPSVGSPTTTSAWKARARSAMNPASASTTSRLAWLAISEATQRSGSRGTPRSGSTR